MELFQTVYVLNVILAARGARILGIFHLQSYSHHQLSDRLFKELAARGHEVTVITGYETKENVTNFKTIVVNTDSKGTGTNLFSLSENNMIWSNMKLDNYLLSLVESTLSNGNVQALIKSKENFDVVIIERHRNEAFHGFCAHFKAHCVLSTSIPASRLINSQLGNLAPPSYIPELCSESSNKMNYFERLYNTFAYAFLTIWYHIYMQPLHNNLMEKHFPNVPDLSDILHNISLVLINTHTATNPPVPLLPNMIDIGGYHIQQPEPLRQDLKDYLDSSNEGVILVSMGSILRSAHISDTKREAVLNALGNLRHNVLWKWDEESMPNHPRNVRLAKWIPQNDVLAHPNVKLFVTHGGLLSITEAMYHGVPVVGIPVFGDQYSNMKVAEDNDCGISVPFKHLTENILSSAIEKVLSNHKFVESARRRSKVIRDNPLDPLDKAIYWIEYVLRHNGAPHLRSPALQLNWFQYFLLDVIAAMAVLITIAVCSCCFCIRWKSNKKQKTK